jgi:hypothetical protein
MGTGLGVHRHTVRQILGVAIGIGFFASGLKTREQDKDGHRTLFSIRIIRRPNADTQNILEIVRQFISVPNNLSGFNILLNDIPRKTHHEAKRNQ